MEASVGGEKVKKQDFCAQEAIMIGYARGSRGYKLWYAKKSCMVVSRHVCFDESDESRSFHEDDIYFISIDAEAKEPTHSEPTTLTENYDVESSPLHEDGQEDETLEKSQTKPNDTSLSVHIPENSNDRNGSIAPSRHFRVSWPPDQWDSAIALILTTSAEPQFYEEALSSTAA